MKKWSVAFLFAVLVSCLLLSGCAKSAEEVKIGVSFGVGEAQRWAMEQGYMEQRAAELGVQIEVRLNKTDTPKTQHQDCVEMIDSGIDVLVLTPRDVTKVGEILAYAEEKDVPVMSYSRVVLGQKVDLFVGCDSNRMGQKQGQYLSELVYKGDYIILRGDEGDNNATLLYEGAMRYLSPISDQINILLDAPVPGWSTEKAAAMVRQAIVKNGNRVDAILAPNDKIAGACAEVIRELGITTPVVITGTDAELDAARRIVAGTQGSTIYMDLNLLACTAVEEAVHIAMGETVTVNADFDNQSGGTVPANLITGQLVTKENLDKVLIDSGYFTREQVYGHAA